MRRHVVCGALAALLLPATSLAQSSALVPVPAGELPSFADDDLDRDSLRRAIAEERRLLRARPEAPVSLGGVKTTRARLLATLERLDALLDLDGQALAAAVASEFACYHSVGRDGQGTVLFTGYHSPCYEGSRVRTERFDTPARRPPPGLTRPSLTRREIDGEGKLDGQGLELVWLARLDAYLLEVQGSGSVRLPDGTLVRLQYAASNGHPYTSLGKELVKDGKLTPEEASIPAIRSYFAAHPEEQDEYLFRNASYVFFHEVDDPPRGCAGAAVTAGRSIATDKRHFPAGALAFVVVDVPVTKDGAVVGWRRRARFVVDQDTGGAIVGPGRVDLYMGADADADAAAGVMKREGALYYLLLREPAPRPGDWTIVGPEPESRPGVLRPSLWLPTDWHDRGVTAMGDVLGTHAAVFFAPSPRTVVVLEGQFERPEQVPILDWERATLTPHGGAPLAVQPLEPWTGHAAGPDVSPPLTGGVLAAYRVVFPPLDPAGGDVTFSVPVLDGVPLVVRFRRWRELVAEAEADLAAWRRHIEASRARSAIGPYLDDDGYRRLIARGDPLVSALLLRELARGEAGDPHAVPRFLVLRVLSTTEWGHRLGVPDHGDERTAARVLERWREQGAPRAPGISPPDR